MSGIIGGTKGFVLTVTGELPVGVENDAAAMQFVMGCVTFNALIVGLLRQTNCEILPLVSLPAFKDGQRQ